MTRQWIALAALVVVCAAGQAGAVEYDWRPGQGVAGVTGYVRAMATWDPDGPGPLPEWLVIGGEFGTAGTVDASNVVAWDGRQWHALGQGLGYNVLTLAVYNGQLIAGGTFSRDNFRYIARFNGTDWEPLGEGTDLPVYALTVFEGRLIAGGMFNEAGGKPCNGLAAWDGWTWERMDVGLDYAKLWPYVGHLLVHDSGLIAAGDFEIGGQACYLIRWDGSSWQPIPVALGPDRLGSRPDIVSMTSYGDELIIGADFQGLGDDASCRFIARFDGTDWHPCGQIDGIPLAMTLFNGRLIASIGPTYDSQIRSHLAAWDGRTWQDLPGEAGGAWAMAVYNNELIIGGGANIPGEPCLSIARFDGWQWHSLADGLGGPPDLVGVYNGELLLGGYFSGTTQGDFTGVVRWNNGMLEPIGEGFGYGSRWYTYLHTLAEFNGDLVVSGSFDNVGDVPCNSIARFDGQAWQPLAGGMGNGSRLAFVQALTTWNEDLVAGGSFDSAGGTACSSVARWDGQAWHAMGQIDGWYRTRPWDNTVEYVVPDVLALAVHDDELFAAGYFNSAAGVVCNSIARWDGQAWQPLAGGLMFDEDGDLWPGRANAMLVHSDLLIVAGQFNRAGDVPCNGVAAWDGSRWYALSSPFDPLSPGYGSVHALAVYNGQLVATGGLLDLQPGVFLSNVARYDGQMWHSLSTGVTGSVYSMTPYNGELVVGGGFIHAGGRMSAWLAFWGPQYPGDLNGDGYVDVTDLLILADSFGKMPGDEGYEPACDLNGDGAVDATDLLILAADWGK